MDGIIFILAITIFSILSCIFILRFMSILHVILNYPGLPRLAINEYFKSLEDFRIFVKTLIILFDLPIIFIIFVVGIFLIMIKEGLKKVSSWNIGKEITKLYKYLVYRNK